MSFYIIDIMYIGGHMTKELLYSIAYEDEGAYVRMHGVCTYKDVLEATISLWENPSFESIKYEIFDYLDVTEVNFSDYEVVELAYRDNVASRMTRRAKMAIVATHPDILELSKVYRKTLPESSFDFVVTDTPEAARIWVMEK